MAGLLTYSGNRGLPNRHNQWLSVFSEPFLEFTAAGLFGSYTQFPFHGVYRKASSNKTGSKDRKDLCFICNVVQYFIILCIYSNRVT